MDHLRKIYLEPTNACNLQCRTCMRQVWDEPTGFMEREIFEALLAGLEAFPSARSMAFTGLGEPLLHPRIVEMVAAAHAHGLRTEMTSNALLLSPAKALGLREAGLDQLVVSVDGATGAAFADMRDGAPLDQVIENVRALLALYEPSPQPALRIGMEFVAMRRNIHELPALQKVARQIGASFILVSNVLPYTEELRDEVLYSLRATSYQGQGSPWTPTWILPRMDFSDDTQAPLWQVLRTQANLNYLDIDLNSRNGYCPFVQAGALAVGWSGQISPCPPLSHSYSCYVAGRPKRMRAYAVGQLPAQTLAAIWNEPAYAAFRERVRAFDFPPCVDCECTMAESNEEDCFGNPFPVCGDCLWARGIIRCA